jgi:hypothetical protein
MPQGDMVPAWGGQIRRVGLGQRYEASWCGTINDNGEDEPARRFFQRRALNLAT